MLAKLLDAGEDEGSEKNPLPVDYPKRRASAYPNIYVGPSTLSEIKQAWLKDVAGLSGGSPGRRLALDRGPEGTLMEPGEDGRGLRRGRLRYQFL